MNGAQYRGIETGLKTALSCQKERLSTARIQFANCIWIHQKIESEQDRKRLRNRCGEWLRTERERNAWEMDSDTEWKEWKRRGAKAKDREREVRWGELKKEKRWRWIWEVQCDLYGWRKFKAVDVSVGNHYAVKWSRKSWTLDEILTNRAQISRRRKWKRD